MGVGNVAGTNRFAGEGVGAWISRSPVQSRKRSPRSPTLGVGR